MCTYKVAAGRNPSRSTEESITKDPADPVNCDACVGSSGSSGGNP